MDFFSNIKFLFAYFLQKPVLELLLSIFFDLKFFIKINYLAQLCETFLSFPSFG